jgi:cyclomaltodextrinase
MKTLEIGAMYKHYKGNNYKAIGLARHSETLEELVVYCALYNHTKFGENSLWARPKEMFLGNVIIDGKEVERFEKIDHLPANDMH